MLVAVEALTMLQAEYGSQTSSRRPASSSPNRSDRLVAGWYFESAWVRAKKTWYLKSQWLASIYGRFSINYGLLWGSGLLFFALVGFPGRSMGP